MTIGTGESNLLGRIENLERVVSAKEIFEAISGTTGTITTYANIEISQDDWANGSNAIAVETDAGRPTETSLFTSSEVLIQAVIDTDGNYTLSGTSTAANYAIIWIVKGAALDFGNALIPQGKIIAEYDVENIDVSQINNFSVFPYSGIEDSTQLAITYDASTRQFTVVNSGTSVSVNGVISIPEDETTSAHADATTQYWEYYTSGATALTVGTTVNLSLNALAGRVYYNTDQSTP